MKINRNLLDLLEPVVTGMGYELVGAEFDGHQRVLRLYIDHPEGVGLEACSKVSYQVSGVLDVEDPIPGRYQLEVSSPGLERPLFTLAHFERFKGEMVRVQLSRPMEGRRRFKAQIIAVDGDDVLLLEEGTEFRIAFGQIEKAKLSPVFD